MESGPPSPAGPHRVGPSNAASDSKTCHWKMHHITTHRKQSWCVMHKGGKVGKFKQALEIHKK